MDKRSAKRLAVGGQVRGRMALVESIEVEDISMTGIRFKSMRRVGMNSRHRIKIRHGDVSIVLKGNIVRSTFKGLQQTETKNMPVYEVGMHFEGMSDEETQSLEKLISILGNE
jgi:hypothetical protein